MREVDVSSAGEHAMMRRAPEQAATNIRRGIKDVARRIVFAATFLLGGTLALTGGCKSYDYWKRGQNHYGIPTHVDEASVLEDGDALIGKRVRFTIDIDGKPESVVVDFIREDPRSDVRMAFEGRTFHLQTPHPASGKPLGEEIVKIMHKEDGNDTKTAWIEFHTEDGYVRIDKRDFVRGAIAVKNQGDAKIANITLPCRMVATSEKAKFLEQRHPPLQEISMAFERLKDQ